MNLKHSKPGICAALALILAACTVGTAPNVQAPGDTGPGELIPPLMLPYGSGWAGGIGRRNGLNVPPDDFLPPDYFYGDEHRQAAIDRGVAPEDVPTYLRLRIFGHYIPPESGIGPMSDDPEHPYFNNAMVRELGLPGGVRIADVDNESARNLQPWALEAVKAQNELARAGRNGQTRQARCWELGVPNFNEVPQPLYFIQTPDEIVMYMGHRVRHIYMNVPHSDNLPLSWYGESVGHYEGDTLVVETIGQNDKTFVDGYRTPHTTDMHVVERYRVINDGRGLETTYTVTDPGAFLAPWSGRRPRYLIANRPLIDQDRICAAGNEDIFDQGLDPLQKAETPDF